MKSSLLAVCLLALAAASHEAPRDLSQINPPYPRIGNCYGADLGWKTWDEAKEYWSKLDLFIGGGYDLHYDWENPRWEQVLPRVEQNVWRLREANPHAIVLAYVDVIEGPDDAKVPAHWWELREGKRWSGWPGYFRINTSLPEVLEFNLNKVRSEVLGRECLDGVFYDCWHPDEWLVPRTAALRDGQAVVMVNNWNLPADGFEHLNGCLAEDEVNRIIEGQVAFDEFMGRYLAWCARSRKPVVTMLVCHPRGLDMDPWHWAKVDWRERQRLAEGLRTSDLQTMRFGLTTTLMGDGYFGYDRANMGRGDWWWYPEYDAPLGYPKGAARRNADGTWQREFTGGRVVVNGSLYDAVVELPSKCRDISTGRVGTRFTLPMYDGRIFVPTDEPATPGEDTPPRLTRTPPSSLQGFALDDGLVVARTPGGLELRFEPTGELRTILLAGSTYLNGGWPVAASLPFITFQAQSAGQPDITVSPVQVRLLFQGTLSQDEQRVRYVETCTLWPDNRFTLHFDFTAETDLNLRMWRHYFFLPVRHWAGAVVRAEGRELLLPAEFGEEVLVPSMQRLEVAGQRLGVKIESSIPLSLVDHRKWGTSDYLLAGYPVSGKVEAGRRWSAEVTLAFSARARM